MKTELNYFVILFALMFVDKVFAVAPIAQFAIDSPTGCSIPHTSFYTDQSTNSPTSWNWNFGDGNTSPLQNPVHNYTTTGDFTVTLTVTNADGGDSTTQTVMVSVPQADFTGSRHFGCGPLINNFTDSSLFLNSTPSSWFWEFGDGGSSALQNPQYTYQTPGIYTTKLTITDANGCTDTRERSAYIQVIGPDISFKSTPVSGQVPLSVDFTDMTIFGAPIRSWAWNFDDGGSSNLKNPSHIYNSEGVYATSLTVTDIDGCSRTEINGSTDGPVTVIADQVITFNDPADQVYSLGGAFNAPASSDSGLIVTITSNTLSVCTVSGNTINIISAGTCDLTASQAGSNIYNPASNVNQSVNITQASQAITFNDPADQVFIANGMFNIPATSDSGLVVTMTSNNTSVCTVSGFTATMLLTGVCSITASQAGDANYNPALDVIQEVNLNPADNDGVDDLIENAVPDADGTGFGDGDGNGVLDSTEGNVASFIANNGVDYLTVKSDFELSNLTVSQESTTDLTTNVRFPYGFLGFTANSINAGDTITIEVYVPYNTDINSYWKKGNDAQWYDIATDVTHIGTSKTRLTFQLTEGGNLDSDLDNTTLTDPGAAGAIVPIIPMLSISMLVLLSLLLMSVVFYKVHLTYINHTNGVRK